MTDIVERLRGTGANPPCDADRTEAANEIEALRKRIAELTGVLSNYVAQSQMDQQRIAELESPLCNCATCGKCSGRAAANSLEARIAELVDERGELLNHVLAFKEDAARYRWLRGMIFDDRIIIQSDRMLHGDALDVAIDAARGEKA